MRFNRIGHSFNRFSFLSLFLLQLSLNSCEFGANAVDGSGIELKEGMSFEYDNLAPFSFRFPEPVGSSIEIRLLSMVASIGGRDNVLGFVSSIAGELIFTDVRNGEVWYYFTANRESERAKHQIGEWIKLPGTGDEPVSATIRDSVIQFDFEFVTPIQRDLVVHPVGQFKFYVDGYSFNARKVKVVSTYTLEQQDPFGLNDEQEITIIDDLGVIAEKVTRDESGFEVTHFIMSEIHLKD